MTELRISSKNQWPSYLFSGAAAIFASWTLLLLTGCRFGNHVEAAPDPDQTSGYYTTEPKTFTVCAASEESNCATAPLDQIPDLPAKILTDPVILAMKDLNTRQAQLISTGEKPYGIGIFAEVDGTLGAQMNSEPVPIWTSELCTYDMKVVERGKYTREATGKKAPSGADVSGRIQLVFQVFISFKGTECGSQLKEMADCLDGPNHCGGATDEENQLRYEVAMDHFGLFLRNGVVTPDQIPDLALVAYEISYE